MKNILQIICFFGVNDIIFVMSKRCCGDEKLKKMTREQSIAMHATKVVNLRSALFEAEKYLLQAISSSIEELAEKPQFFTVNGCRYSTDTLLPEVCQYKADREYRQLLDSLNPSFRGLPFGTHPEDAFRRI